jgi:stage II sporulation protein E
MYFRSETGVLYIILSDGMGSGPEALEESRSGAGLLESFLKAGVEPEGGHAHAQRRALP